MFSVKYSGKTIWYTQKLSQRVRIAKDAALYRAAGFIRTAAKRSMRVRRGASRPGTPPHAHTRTGLRQIQFIVDQQAGAALIGPIKFSGSNFFDQPVPYIQEFGGIFRSRKRSVTYPERSYMKYTLNRLVASGQLSRDFNYSMARIL